MNAIRLYLSLCLSAFFFVSCQDDKQQATTSLQWEELSALPDAIIAKQKKSSSAAAVEPDTAPPAEAVQDDSLRVTQYAQEDNCLYFIGGYDASKVSQKDAWRYSPKAKKWTRLADMPSFPAKAGAAFGAHSILMLGQDNCLYAYNTVVDRWSQLGKLPESVAGDSMMLADGRDFYISHSAGVWKGQVISEQSFGWVNWTVITLYLIAMIGMGVFFMYRAKSSEDFFKASGRIPWWAVSISIFATMLSAITFMAIPAKTYGTDWRYFLMAVTIFIAAFPVVRYYLPFFRRLNITSAYEYLELRFNVVLRSISSALFIFFMIVRMAMVLYLPSLALMAATGIDIYTCILLMSVITIIYSSIGGVEAVVWGDVVQGIILMGGALFALGYLIVNTEGSFLEIAIESQKFEVFNFAFDFTNATFWVVIVGGIASQIISYTSDQTVIQRYITVKSEKQAAKSIITNGVLSLVASAIFYMIGTALFTYFQGNPSALDAGMSSGDAIFPYFIMTKIPVGLAGVLVAAIFAAAMSTVSSNINSIATAFTIDMYQKRRPQASDRDKLWAARWASIVSGVLGCGFALLMATWQIKSIFDWFNSMLGLLTSGLGALFFMGIFFDRIGGRAALIGFVTGTIGLWVVTTYTNVSFVLYGLIGMTLITLISLVMSFILPREEKNLAGLTWKKKPTA